MTNAGKKLESPLKLNMSFGEALSRFVTVDQKEVTDSVERSKTKKPGQDATPPRRSFRQSVKKPTHNSGNET